MSSAAHTARPSPRKHPRPQSGGADGGPQPLKIGEAAKLLGVEAYVLRFWETQFPFLRPRHARSRSTRGRFTLGRPSRVDTQQRRSLLPHQSTVAGEGFFQRGIDRWRIDKRCREFLGSFPR